MDADRCIILFIIKPKIPCLFKKYFLQIVERKDQVQHVLMLSSYAVSIYKKKTLDINPISSKHTCIRVSQCKVVNHHFVIILLFFQPPSVALLFDAW